MMMNDANEPSVPLAPPEHPLPPGGFVPDLHLAGGFDVVSGLSIQSMPDPGKPTPPEYVLHGSPELGGVDPANPAPAAPNLAGVEGVPLSPVKPSVSPVITSDATSPDFASLHVPLQPYDLDAGMNYAYGAEFAADPLLPDLTEYRQPYGLDVHNLEGPGHPLFRPDPLLGDLLAYEVPAGATVVRDPLMPDPTVPDLQHPTLEPEVHMSMRPGDLAEEALQTMHLQPTYAQLDGVPYSQSFMDQSGTNTARRRHLDLLQSGLDAEG